MNNKIEGVMKEYQTNIFVTAFNICKNARMRRM